ncbi:hypothetical protein ACWGI8_31045 [Streptomyces sp. NPDC054841]
MTEKDADLTTVVAVRLGSGKDRHRGLLFVRKRYVRKGLVRKGLVRRREEARREEARRKRLDTKVPSPYATGPTPTRADGHPAGTRGRECRPRTG